MSRREDKEFIDSILKKLRLELNARYLKSLNNRESSASGGGGGGGGAATSSRPQANVVNDFAALSYVLSNLSMNGAATSVKKELIPHAMKVILNKLN